MRSLRISQVLGIVIFALAGEARALAQDVDPDDRPALLVPKKPPTQKEKDQRESLYQYSLGLTKLHEDHLVDALQAFQEAARLDPDAAPVFKAQVPILLAMNQQNEALAAITRVVALDPADADSWYIQARIFRTLGKSAEARAALHKGLSVKGVMERPELAHQMSYDLAGLLESDGSFKQAAEAYDRAVRILEHPQHSMELGLRPETIRARIAEVYERMGNLYGKDRQYDRAVSAFQKAQEKAPDHAGRINFSLAQLFTEQGKSAEALTALEGYLSLKPQGLEAYQMKIKLLTSLGQSEQILPWLEDASRGDHFNDPLRLLLAGQYLQAKQLGHAEKIYRDMHDKSPSVDVYRGLFGVYRSQGAPGLEKLLQLLNCTFDKAAQGPSFASVQGRPMLSVLREDAELAKDLIRQGLEKIDTRKDLKWQTGHYLAILAEKHKQLGDAERYFHNCLSNMAPSSPDSLEVHAGLIRVLLKARKFEAAEQICKERLVKAEGQDRLVYLDDLARILSRMDRFKEALAAVDEAIKLAEGAKDKQAIQFTRIRILSQKTDYQQAVAECEALLKASLLPSDMMEIHYLLSNIYAAAKQLDKSEDELKWVLRFDPSNATANNDLGYVWADQNKNLKEAEEMIRVAIEVDRNQRKNNPNLAREDDQDNAAYVDSLGWVLFRLGKIEEARKELERASALPGGEDPVIWDHLGDVYQQLRMYPEARAAWQKGIELFERDHLRPMDDRYKELQRKVKLAVPAP